MKELIKNLVLSIVPVSPNDISKYISKTPDPKLGDYSCTIAFKLATPEKKPNEIALDIAGKIKPPEIIKKIDVIGPYINFYFNKEKLAKKLIEKTFVKSSLGSEVLIEHTSVNPSGPIHVGRLRNTLIGDCLVRMHKSLGYKVSTHYYVNDVGKQIAIIALGVKNKLKPSASLIKKYKKHAGRQDFKIFFIYVQANKKYEKNKKFRKEVDDLLIKCEKGDKKALEMLKKTAAYCLEGQRKTYEKLGVSFDSFDFESGFLDNGKAYEIIEKLKKHELSRKLPNGAWSINLKDYGIPKKEGTVFLRANGTSVYTSRDLAYHDWKLSIASRIINVLGEDHKLEFKELKTILRLLGYDSEKINVVHFSFVNLEAGKKMSTRRGETLPADLLIDEGVMRVKKKSSKINNKTALSIALSAVKFSILNVDHAKSITFNWDNALSFEGESGPYCQYACVRAERILSKLGGFETDFNASVLSESELDLIIEASSFQELVEEAVNKLNPSMIAKYAFNLAFDFNKFYEKHSVINEKDELKRISRAHLVKRTLETLSLALELLGIEVPKSM